jgi:hypothetical protein
MAKKEKDYTEQQKALFATGRFCDKCAKDVNLVGVPGYQVDLWYGFCSNCGLEEILPGPAMYWNGEEEVP